MKTRTKSASFQIYKILIYRADLTLKNSLPYDFLFEQKALNRRNFTYYGLVIVDALHATHPSSRVTAACLEERVAFASNVPDAAHELTLAKLGKTAQVWKVDYRPFEEVGSDTCVLVTQSGNSLWNFTPWLSTILSRSLKRVSSLFKVFLRV